MRRTLILAAVIAAVAGCGWVGDDSGVATVRSESAGRTAEAAVTSPTIVDRPTADEEATSDVDEVDTLVEPETVVRPTTIAVVGDSLTLSAEDELLVALTSAGLDVLAIDALESRRITRGGIPPGVEAVEQIVAEAEPGLWVIALGTNDVASSGSLDGFRTEVRTLLDLIPEDAPVIWVDLWIGGQEETISRANLQLRAELGRWQGGSAVVNWFSHGLDDGVITADGVHLTTAGQALFAASVVAAVDELFPGE